MCVKTGEGRGSPGLSIRWAEAVFNAVWGKKGRGTDISQARQAFGKLQAHYQLAHSSQPAPWIEQLKAALTVLTHPT